MSFLDVTISCLGRNLNAFSSSNTDKVASAPGALSLLLLPKGSVRSLDMPALKTLCKDMVTSLPLAWQKLRSAETS